MSWASVTAGIRPDRVVKRVHLLGANAPLTFEQTRAGLSLTLPANRPRVATDWFNDIVEHRQFVRLGLIQPDRSGLAVAEQTDIYYRTDGQPLDHAAHGVSGLQPRIGAETPAAFDLVLGRAEHRASDVR